MGASRDVSHTPGQDAAEVLVALGPSVWPAAATAPAAAAAGAPAPAPLPLDTTARSARAGSMPLNILHALITGKTGSNRYMSPENWKGEAYTAKADVFSFAIIAWEVLMGKHAYRDTYLSSEQIAKAVAEDKLRPTLPASGRAKWPEPLGQLVMACWAHEEQDRPTFAHVVDQLAAFQRAADEDPSLYDALPLAGSRRGGRGMTRRLWDVQICTGSRPGAAIDAMDRGTTADDSRGDGEAGTSASPSGDNRQRCIIA